MQGKINVIKKLKERMPKLHCFLIFLLPLSTLAHPGVGIVKDSKGNIFYTDLHQVWKINNNTKTIVVPNVHTHELFIDNEDNLYGEGGYYDDQTEKFFHYLWVLQQNGQIDTIVGMKEAYVTQDFSLVRDKKSNEFYIKRFLKPHSDTNNIYKKTPDGFETIFATGNFKDVNWLHPQEDGSLLYASGNSIFRVDSLGNIRTVSNQLINSNSEKDVLIWGIWQDNFKNVYVAVFSDKTVKRIGLNGSISTIYKSNENWAPLHGTFDNESKLLILEGSDNNDVQVITASFISINTAETGQSGSKVLPFVIIGCIVLVIGLWYLKTKN